MCFTWNNPARDRVGGRAVRRAGGIALVKKLIHCFTWNSRKSTQRLFHVEQNFFHFTVGKSLDGKKTL